MCVCGVGAVSSFSVCLISLLNEAPDSHAFIKNLPAQTQFPIQCKYATATHTLSAEESERRAIFVDECEPQKKRVTKILQSSATAAATRLMENCPSQRAFFFCSWLHTMHAFRGRFQRFLASIHMHRSRAVAKTRSGEMRARRFLLFAARAHCSAHRLICVLFCLPTFGRHQFSL
jgi:hypothetical protein